MHYRTLGKTGLEVSLLSFGTGGPSAFGQRRGLVQDEQTRLVRRALDLGINFFDTSSLYDESEVILGRALEGVPRDSYVIGTKWRTPDHDPDDLRKTVHKSLKLLGTDHIDVMQFHGPLPEEYDTIVEKAYPAMAQLRDEGKIRFIGLSERFTDDYEHTLAVKAIEAHPDYWDTFMLKYGILNQVAADDALPLAKKHNVGILNMAAVRIKLPNRRLLEQQIADWKERGLIPDDSLPEKDPLDWLVHDDVDSVVSAAYKFGADHEAVSTVITGTATLAHLEGNVAALDNPTLDEADAQRLRDLFGHIAEYA